jgi:hypothetical protein
VRKNPGKPKHLRQAREKLQSAKGLYRSVRDAGEGEAGFRQEILLYAHATAAQAMQEAANAGAPGLRDEAYRLQQQIEQHLSRLRRPGQTNPIENPCVRRFKDLPTAQRDAARRAQRTDQPYFIYELSKNPRFAVMSADHPVQQSYEKGIIGLGKATLRGAVSPRGDSPLVEEGGEYLARWKDDEGDPLQHNPVREADISWRKKKRGMVFEDGTRSVDTWEAWVYPYGGEHGGPGVRMLIVKDGSWYFIYRNDQPTGRAFAGLATAKHVAATFLALMRP